MKNPLNHWRIRREESEIKISTVATVLGVSNMCVYNWESGRTRPRSWKPLAVMMSVDETTLIRLWSKWHASIGNKKEAAELRCVAQYYNEKEQPRFSVRKRRSVARL